MTGTTLFAPLMDLLPLTTLARYVARYGGDKGVRTLRCAEQFRVVAFAQPRESLRDIEACRSARQAKLYHMGFREPIRRSTLADANESRDLENVVKTQIWIAASIYVLIAIVKKKLNLDAALYTLLQILSVTLSRKCPYSKPFRAETPRSDRTVIKQPIECIYELTGPQ